MAKREPAELIAVDRAASRVDKLRGQLREAIERRNMAAELAKRAGHPAGEVYRRAGIVRSTASRARTSATGSPPGSDATSDDDSA